MTNDEKRQHEEVFERIILEVIFSNYCFLTKGSQREFSFECFFNSLYKQFGIQEFYKQKLGLRKNLDILFKYFNFPKIKYKKKKRNMVYGLFLNILLFNTFLKTYN